MDQTSSDVQKIDLMKYFDRFFRAFRRLWKYVVLFLLIGILAFEMKEVLFFNTTIQVKPYLFLLLARRMSITMQILKMENLQTH